MKAKLPGASWLISATILAAGLGFAGSAPAHPHEADAKGEEVERVIVLTGNADGKEHKRRIRTVHIGRPHGHIGCDRDRTKYSEVADQGRERTRVVLCGNGLSSAEHAEKLERALSRIQSSERLSTEHRERIASRLRETIDRLRSRPNRD
jgi:hypothetical protein